MHSLMRLRLTKRMVIVNNAGTNPAPSSATRTAERKKTGRTPEPGMRLYFSLFMTSGVAERLKPFFFFFL